MDRIAVLIGSKGATAKSIREASGCKELDINSETGDVEVLQYRIKNSEERHKVLYQELNERISKLELALEDKIKNISEQQSVQNIKQKISPEVQPEIQPHT